MRNYTEVRDEAGAATLLEAVDRLHDTVVGECVVVNRAFRTPNGTISCGGDTSDVRLTLLRFGTPGAVELVALSATRLTLEPNDGAFSTGSIDVRADRHVDDRLAIEIRCDGLGIDCERLLHRPRPTWLGPERRLHGECPSPHELAGEPLGDGWYQCPGCTDAAFALPPLERTLCPKCHRVLVVEPTAESRP